MILDDEMGFIDTHYSELAVVRITKLLIFSSTEHLNVLKICAIKDLLAVSYYRFHLQKKVLIVAEILMALGLLS